MTAQKKRSLEIEGRQTSVSIEPDFWWELKRIARQRHKSLTELVEVISEQRTGKNLSSEIRLFVLREIAREQKMRD